MTDLSDLIERVRAARSAGAAPDALIKLDYHGKRKFETVAGIRIGEISGSETRLGLTGKGIFKDQTAEELIRRLFFSGTIRNWEITIPDMAAIEGPYQIVSLEYAGDHAGEVSFEMTLESAGPLEVTLLAVQATGAK